MALKTFQNNARHDHLHVKNPPVKFYIFKKHLEYLSVRINIIITMAYYQRPSLVNAGGRGGFFYKSPRYQTGLGVGNIFRGLLKGIAPIAKVLFNFGSKVLKTDLGKSITNTAKNAVIDSGSNFANEVLSGSNVKDSFKTNLKKASKTIGDKIESIITTKPKKKRKRSRVVVKKKKVNIKKIKRDYLSDSE